MLNKKHQNKTSVEKELQEIAPILSSIEKQNAFVVPDDYFDTLYENIQNKCYQNKTVSLWSHFTNILRKPVYSISIAAVIIILISIGFNFFKPNSLKISEDKKLISEQSNNANQDNINNDINSDIQKNSSKQNQKIDKTNNKNKSEIALKQDKKKQLVGLNNHKNSPELANNSQKTEQINNSNSIINQTPSINNKKENNPIIASNSYQPGQTNSEGIATKQKQISNITNQNTNNQKSKNISVEESSSKKLFVNLGNDICSNSPITLDAGNSNRNCTYKWSTGETTKAINVNSSGKYSVTVINKSDANNFAKDEINVKILPSPIVDLGPDKTICTNESLILYAIKDEEHLKDYTYKWSMNNETKSFINLKNLLPGTYKIKAEVSGCKTIYDEMTLTVNDCSIEIPNVFTPNGDGKNDFFVIKGLESYPNSKLIIFNRNGVKVFESKNYKNNWDGGNNSNSVYYYILTISDENKTERKGTITIYGKQ